MKRLIQMTIYLVLLSALTLHIGTGCEPYRGKAMQHYLCSVNSDGSGFQRLYYNDNENTEPGCSSGLYKNYLFRVYAGEEKLLLVFENNYRIMNTDGSGLEGLTTFIQHHDSNVTFAADPDLAYFNYNLILYKGILRSGSYRTVVSAPDALHYPLGDAINDKVYMSLQNGSIITYDPAANQSTTLPTAFQILRAYYVPSLDKYLCTNYGGSVLLVSADGAVADTLLNINTANYSTSEVMQPVGDGTQFLTVGHYTDYAIHNLLLHNLSDTTAVNLGTLYNHSHYFMDPTDNTHFAIDVCRNGRYIFWCDTYAIYKYDLQTSAREVVMVSGEDNFAAQKFESISSSADGSKLYFVCELYDKTPLR